MYSSSTTAVITRSWHGIVHMHLDMVNTNIGSDVVAVTHLLIFDSMLAIQRTTVHSVAVEELWLCALSCMLLITWLSGRTNQGVIYFQPNIYHSWLSFMSILNSPWNSYLASAHYVILSLCKEETWHLQSFSRIKTTALWQMRLLFAQTAWCIIIHLMHLQSFEDAVAE